MCSTSCRVLIHSTLALCTVRCMINQRSSMMSVCMWPIHSSTEQRTLECVCACDTATRKHNICMQLCAYFAQIMRTRHANDGHCDLRGHLDFCRCDQQRFEWFLKSVNASQSRLSQIIICHYSLLLFSNLNWRQGRGYFNAGNFHSYEIPWDMRPDHQTHYS